MSAFWEIATGRMGAWAVRCMAIVAFMLCAVSAQACAVPADVVALMIQIKRHDLREAEDAAQRAAHMRDYARQIDQAAFLAEAQRVGGFENAFRGRVLLGMIQTLALGGTLRSEADMLRVFRELEQDFKAHCNLVAGADGENSYGLPGVLDQSGATLDAGRVLKGVNLTWNDAAALGLVSGSPLALLGVLLFVQQLTRARYARSNQRKTCLVSARLCFLDQTTEGAISILGRNGCRFVLDDAADMQSVTEVPEGMLFCVEAEHHSLTCRVMERGDGFLRLVFLQPIAPDIQDELFAASQVRPETDVATSKDIRLIQTARSLPRGA